MESRGGEIVTKANWICVLRTQETYLDKKYILQRSRGN